MPTSVDRIYTLLQDIWITHHSALVTMEILHDLLRLFVPQEDVPTVGPRDDVLTVRPVEIHAFH